MEKYSKHFMIAFFILIVYLSFLIIKPFATSLLASFILAYIFYPLFKKIERVTGKKKLSAFILSLFLVILVTIPTIFILNSVTKEVFVLYTIGEQRIISGNVLGIDCKTSPYMCKKLEILTKNLKLRFYLEQNLGNFRNYLTEAITEFVFSVPRRLLEIFITLFTTFFLFKDGDHLVKRIRSIMPLKEHHERPLTRKLNDITYAILYGNVVIAIVEGVLGGLAFWIVGIPSPIFWGLVMTLLALLPVIGAGFIWIPATTLLFLGGHLGSAIFLGIFCMIFVTGIDTFVKPVIIGDRGKVHPLIVVFGVLGGVLIFNVIGLIIGPLILALLVTFLEIYETEKIKEVVKRN